MSEGGHAVWSDGSCLGNPGPGGYAAIVLAPDGSELGSVSGGEARSTNQKMELRAAAEGLLLVPEGARVTVMTDSKYVVDGMTSWIKGWKRRGWRKADGAPVANLEYWQAPDAAASARQTSFRHVRGHAGVELNERCDRLANGEALAARNAKR